MGGHRPSSIASRLVYRLTSAKWRLGSFIVPLLVAHIGEAPDQDILPPSFESAQYDVVLRRQRKRPEGGGVKLTTIPSRFLHLSNDFEFAGWGTITRVELSKSEIEDAELSIKKKQRLRNLGQFTASSLAGNAVLGSVFYALPAVVGVSTV
jgi:hypothetical protein